MALLLDEDSFVERDHNLVTQDILHFKGARPYGRVLKEARKQHGRNDGVRTGVARVEGQAVAAGFVDADYMGGAMGCGGAERLCRLFELAAREGLPALVVTAGAQLRHQEGMLALSQLETLSAARARMRRAQVAFVSVLVAPLPGAAAHAYAYAGDINLAEPGLLAPPPGNDAPLSGERGDDALLAKGLVDRVVSRLRLKEEVVRFVRLFS